LIVPTFDDSRTMSATVIDDGWWDSTSSNAVPSIEIEGGVSNQLSGVTVPVSIAAATVTTLFVEPGSYTFVSGRFCSLADAGCAGSVSVAPSTLAIARMSPDCVSMTIAVAPFEPVAVTSSVRTCSTRYCSARSTVSTRSRPRRAFTVSREPPGRSRPCGSRSTTSFPGRPLSASSYCDSSPPRPSLSVPTKPTSDAATPSG
jgi:hypothetical protein